MDLYTFLILFKIFHLKLTYNIILISGIQHSDYNFSSNIPFGSSLYLLSLLSLSTFSFVSSMFIIAPLDFCMMAGVKSLSGSSNIVSFQCWYLLIVSPHSTSQKAKIFLILGIRVLDIWGIITLRDYGPYLSRFNKPLLTHASE